MIRYPDTILYKSKRWCVDKPVSIEKIQDYYNYLVGCISVLWVQFHSSLIVHIMHPKLVDIDNISKYKWNKIIPDAKEIDC